MQKKIEKIKKEIHFCITSIKDIDTFLKIGILFPIYKNKEIEIEIEKVFLEVKNTLPPHFYNPILYLIGELSDNINQHSKFSEGFIFINHNKNNKDFNFIIYDDGISIPGAFENNNVIFNDDSKAITMAIEGNSTKKEEGRGYGLSSSVKLVEKGLNGKIAVFSRNGVYQSKIKESNNTKGLKGTFIHINFKDSGEDLNIYEYLD